jgi:hypothetical protein
MHPVIRNGKPNGQASFTRDQDGTLAVHSKDADGSTSEGRFSMSPDGNTSTIEGTSKSKDGKESTETSRYGIELVSLHLNRRLSPLAGAL